MHLKPEQFKLALQKKLAPVYFISGDEPLQLGEMADAVRAVARQMGYLNRELLQAEATGFSWHQLAHSADSLSVFADKKIIDLRLPSGAPGIDGSKALITYCGNLPEDTVLLITAGKVAKEALKSRWLQALDKVGAIVQVWPLEKQDLIHWLGQRLQQRGLSADPEGVKILASRIEGNLLAAAQEIEKLYVLYGACKLSTGQIVDVVADNARYDAFKLIDAVLSANVNQLLRTFSGLQAENVPAPVILWALAREVRVLSKIKFALKQGQSKELVFKNHQVWDKRKTLINEAIARLSDADLNRLLVLGAKADRQIKGQQSGDAWETLRTICLLFASVQVLAG
ncbi:MAG: DNA polymerase III subunit delta [Methylovulum sp.]|nr:DNA polymerase III subunit delta [Methylovulum sp.]